MFFFIHRKILMSITFYLLVLVFKHCFFHWHKFTNCIYFESVQEMLKSISKLLCILINHLRHNLSSCLLMSSTLLIRAKCVIFFIMLCLMNRSNSCPRCCNINEGLRLWSWWNRFLMVSLSLPSSRELIYIVKVCIIN